MRIHYLIKQTIFLMFYLYISLHLFPYTIPLFNIPYSHYIVRAIMDGEIFYHAFAEYCIQRVEYGAFGFLKHFIFKLRLILFTANIFIFSTICQMHYIFCWRLVVLFQDIIQSNKFWIFICPFIIKYVYSQLQKSLSNCFV